MSPGRTAAVLCLCLWTLTPSGLAEEPAVELHYDLRPGDHLVYHQSLERQVTGVGERDPQRRSFALRREWTSHVLVTRENNGWVAVGFQRNRTQAELLRYEEGGRDRLEDEHGRFNERVAALSPYFAEADWFTPQGELVWPSPALREYPSILLLGLREIQPVSAKPLRPGDTWLSTGWINLAHRVSGWDRLHDEDCLRVDGTAAEDRLQMRYWFCPSTGALRRLEFEGAYNLFGRFQVEEKWTWELAEYRREEKIESWLRQPDLQQGALASLLVLNSLPVGAEALYPLLAEDTADVTRLVLALAYRHRLPPPSLDLLTALLHSEDARVRTLVVRVLEGVAGESARPLIERALEDPDYFVRQAALDWMRVRLPEAEAVKIDTVSDAPAFWASLSPVALASRAGTGAAANCQQEPNWSERALLGQLLPANPPGATLWSMTTADFRGRPYVVYVPEDYRGDRPFPLVLYLSGGGGRADQGALSAAATMPKLGYLVVIPDAQNRLWWEEEPPRVVAALLEEVLHSYNIDTNRLYLVGFSNGGTGAFYYATLWPHRFAAAALLMGSGIYSFQEEPLPLGNLGRMPLLFLHGDRDERIDVQAVHDTVRQLRRQAPSAPTEVHIFKGVGHDVTLDNDEGMTVPFLQRHVRDPFPRHLHFRTRTLQFPRHYWIEIAEKEKGLAEVQASIDDDNTVNLKTRKVRRLRLLLRRELFPSAGPVRVVLNGKEVFAGALPENCELLQRSWQEVGDPFLAYSAGLTFDVSR